MHRDDRDVDVREARDRQLRKLTQPSIISTMNSTIDGIGLRIDQAEMLSHHCGRDRLSGQRRRLRTPGRTPGPIAVAQEAAGARDDGFAGRQPCRDLDEALRRKGRCSTRRGLDAVVAHHLDGGAVRAHR